MIHRKRINHPRGPTVTALAYSQDAAEMLRALESQETARLGSLSAARRQLAHQIGCAPGTLENLRRGRLKRIDRWLFDRLEARITQAIAQEITRLSHELEIARAAGRPGCREKSAALAAAVLRAQAILGEDGQ